ncbi:MAG: hypothetical protein Q7S84_01980 [bacterium]|nr:hypothetical protein [bacterium]
MMTPRAVPAYGLDDIKFGADGGTWERAVGLYERGAVKEFSGDAFGFSAVVEGGDRYHVYVSARSYDRGNCDCYLGKQEILCKHMVALGIRAVTGGKPISEKDKQFVSEPVSSGRSGTLTKPELAAAKGAITAAIRCIKSYDGPSRIWFAYQSSLQEGCNRLSAIIADFPVSQQTATLIVGILLRLEDRVSQGGVDDSDGTVGDFMQGAVAVLEAYAKLDPDCIEAFRTLAGRETSFGWEEPLLVYLHNSPVERKVS